MLSIDTNILLPAIESNHPQHPTASRFLESIGDREDVVLSELILVELYVLLRNPAVLGKPLSSIAALGVCQALRSHPHWQIAGFPKESLEFHEQFWPKLGGKDFARRRVYDWRVALTLLQQGVTEFATANVKDFEGFGFRRVWNPLSNATS